jgi:ABC-type phosphate/phosphonate transport system substrate-binding protein
MKKTFILLLAIASLSIVSCKKNCDQAEATKATETYVDATLKYAFDPSSANCKAYKSALENYLDAVEGCEDVSAADISEAKKELDGLDCQ